VALALLASLLGACAGESPAGGGAVAADDAGPPDGWIPGDASTRADGSAAGDAAAPGAGGRALEDARVDVGDAARPDEDAGVPPPGPAEVVAADVVVFGAGTGGVAAAIQAARLGARVVLVEETDWVGGQATAGGVSTMDQGPFANDTGVYAEWIARVEAHYAALGKRARRCGIRAVPCMEPSVGQAILRAMLAEAGVTLYERAAPTAASTVARGGRRALVAVEAAQGQRSLRFEADVFVDATEYGDLLPLVPVRYRAGNATSDALDRGACVQDVTYAPSIKRYPGGAPPDLRIEDPPPGYGPEVEAKFAAIVARGGRDWDAEGWGAGYPVDWTTHVSYRATPDSSAPGDSVPGDSRTITKTGVNWANDFRYTVADLEDRRFEANCAARLHTLQFLYYAQHVLGETEWSVANDEGYATPYNVEQNDCPGIAGPLDAIERHFPPMPYVRESRRMVGLHTLTASEIRRPSPTPFPTSVAVASYAVDLHACDAEADLERALERASDRPAGFVGGAFQIPFESFVPEDVDGLLPAEKNLSQSRLVSGATRLQPSTMHTGQAAGAIAALASRTGRAPRDVNPLEAQLALVDAGLHVGVHTFADVPRGTFYWPAVELASARGILVGRAAGHFGAAEPMSRAQAAVWLARLLDLDTTPPPRPSFDDVPAGHFAYAFVEAVRRAGLTSGCSASPPRYCPEDPLSRAQAATMLARGLGFDPAAVPAAPRFDDVPAGSPHFAAVQWLASHGIVSGCAAGRFCASDPLSRGQAALLTRRALEWRLLGR
jgi:hypothetical protein